ncbi:Egl nine-like 1 [Exaiptasia diaphana]|nr:Egl nine-like 1 [Exaiptasia diaphana]
MICTKVKEGPNSLSNAFQIDSAKIADFVCYELNKNGFCILNDFLSVTASESILHEVITLDNTGIFKDGQLSGGLTSSENAEKYSEKKIRGDRITWVEGKEHNVNNIREIYMSKVDDLVLQCNGTSRKLGGYDIQGRTKAMVACYPGQQTEPLFNRLVLFWSDMRTPHEVLPSNSIRYAITMWYFDKEQREHAKQLQKHKMMGEFGFEVMIKDLESKKNERDQAQKKLDEESERLVKSMMTDEDLDAMSELIKGHDDPRAILGMYGISPSILDALLRVLSKRT